MQLKPTKAARLTLDSGATVMLEYLGAGMFHTCYKDQDNNVYSITKDRASIDGAEDYSKEILSHPTLGVDPNPHIPPVQYVGDIGERRVYKMPLYQKLRASHKTAWAQLKQLQQAREDAWTAVTKEQNISRYSMSKACMRIEDIGQMVNTRVCQLMDAPGVPQELKDALEELRNAASNYGASYVFEFSPRNCMVDAAGRLILLDVLFSLEATAAVHKARKQRAGVRY